MSVLGIRRALVVAPHHDDEILGCGGTMRRLVEEGAEVHVAVVTRGCLPQFDDAAVQQIRGEACAAHERLGVTATRYLDLPAAGLDRIPHADLNRAVGDLIRDVAPDTLFLPFGGDIHLDHQLVFTSALVAARPRAGAFPARIYAYETLSETNWNAPHVAPTFTPNVFVDIAAQLDHKLAAFALYASQVQPAPHERSLETLRALAVVRGATVQRVAAEAFMLVRQVD